MTAAELLTDRRRFFIVLAAVTALGFAVLAVTPMSPGYLRPTTFVAIAFTAAMLVTALAVRAVGSPARHFFAVVVLTTALAVAMAGSEPDRAIDVYLLWFPWIAIYGALSPLLLVAFGNATVVSAGAFVGVAGHGDLAESSGLVTVVTVFSVAFAALLVHGLSSWTRTQSDQDALTLLSSRAGLLRRADPALARSVAQGRRTVLVLVDVNHFREFNDALGHDAGDDLLRLIAGELRTVTPEPLFLGRLGSDEFALVMDGSTLSGSPAAAAEQLRAVGRTVLEQIRGPFRVNGVPVEVEASAGIAVAPRDGNDLSALLPCADAALHRAKRDGAQVGVWDAGMAGVRQWEIALFAELREAIRHDELVVYYQPLLSTHTGKVAGVEALVRWQHPQRGLLPPGAFLPMAERSELISDVTEWVLDDALRQCASWAAAGLHVPVSVNLSARMLVMDELTPMVSDALARHSLPPDVLTLEITESAFVTQPARAAAMLRDLRTQGVKLSLDDFGTGYSSMEILKAFPFDEVKIDRGFVADARGSLSDAAIVRTVLDLGHRLGLRVVGEGVENQETMAMMTELGCDILQGDVVSRPQPPAALEPILAAGVLPLAATSALAATAEPEAGPSTGAAATRAATSEVPSDAPVVKTGPGGTKTVPVRATLSSPVPPDEDTRVAALRRYGVLDTPRETEFDDVAVLAAQVCDTPMGSVSFVEGRREWFKASYGIDVTEIPRDGDITTYTLVDHEFHEVHDTTADVRFAFLQTATPAPPRYIAAAPVVTPDGHAVGGVGVADRIPRTLTPGQRRALVGLARRVAGMLEARREAWMLDRVTEALKALDHLWYPDELTTAANLLAEVAREILDAEAASVLLAEIPGSTVFHAAASATKAGVTPLFKPGISYTGRDDSSVGAALRTQAPVYIADASASPFVSESPIVSEEVVERLEIGSGLVVPVPGEGAVLGGVVVRWRVPRAKVDAAGMRAVSLLCGQAGHTLARLRAAQTRAREFGIDPTTGLVSRGQFLTTLQSMPTGTAVCLLAIRGRVPEGAGDRVFRAVAGRLREVAGR